jgi:transcriptional regulator with XRE-family HTH domain
MREVEWKTSLRDHRYLELLKLLKKAREERGLSQEAVARKLRRPQSFVSKSERAERRIDVVEFLDLAMALGVDPWELLEQLEHPAVRSRRTPSEGGKRKTK